MVNTSEWLVSVIEFANKIKFFDSFQSFKLKMTARIQESSNNIDIILPGLSTLAKLFVEAMQPKYLQLSFNDFLNTT